MSRGFVSAVGNRSGPSQRAGAGRDKEKDHEPHKQDLGVLSRARRDSGEAENSGDDCHDEKRERPAKHDELLEWWEAKRTQRRDPAKSMPVPLRIYSAVVRVMISGWW